MSSAAFLQRPVKNPVRRPTVSKARQIQSHTRTAAWVRMHAVDWVLLKLGYLRGFFQAFFRKPDARKWITFKTWHVNLPLIMSQSTDLVLTIREESYSTVTDSWDATIIGLPFNVRPSITIPSPFSPEEEKDIAWYLEQHATKDPFAVTKANRVRESILRYGQSLSSRISSFLPTHRTSYGIPFKIKCLHFYIEAKDQSSRFHALHWELLEDVACWHAQFPKVIVCRLVPPTIPAAVPHRQSIFNVLFISARPPGHDAHPYLFISKPFLDIIESIPNVKDQIRVHFCRPATFQRFEEILNSYDKGFFSLIHFDVHGEIKRSRPGLHFSPSWAQGNTDETFISGDRLGLLLGNCRVETVVLNACTSATTIASHANNLAYTLCKSGVSNVMAMSFAVTGSAALLFLRTMYYEFFVGQRGLQEAAYIGRQKLREKPARPGRFGASTKVEDSFIAVLYQNHGHLTRWNPDSCNAVPPLPEMSVDEHCGRPHPVKQLFGRDFSLIFLEDAFAKANVVHLQGVGGVGKSLLCDHAADWWLRSGFIKSYVPAQCTRNQNVWRADEFYSSIANYLVQDHSDDPEACRRTVSASRTLIVLDFAEIELLSWFCKTDMERETLLNDFRSFVLEFARKRSQSRALLLLVSRSALEFLKTDLPSVQTYILPWLEVPEATGLVSSLVEDGQLLMTDDSQSLEETRWLIEDYEGNPLCLEAVIPLLQHVRNQPRLLRTLLKYGNDISCGTSGTADPQANDLLQQLPILLGYISPTESCNTVADFLPMLRYFKNNWSLVLYRFILSFAFFRSYFPLQMKDWCKIICETGICTENSQELGAMEPGDFAYPPRNRDTDEDGERQQALQTCTSHFIYVVQLLGRFGFLQFGFTDRANVFDQKIKIEPIFSLLLKSQIVKDPAMNADYSFQLLLNCMCKYYYSRSITSLARQQQMITGDEMVQELENLCIAIRFSVSQIQPSMKDFGFVRSICFFKANISKRGLDELRTTLQLVLDRYETVQEEICLEACDGESPEDGVLSDILLAAHLASKWSPMVEFSVRLNIVNQGLRIFGSIPEHIQQLELMQSLKFCLDCDKAMLDWKVPYRGPRNYEKIYQLLDWKRPIMLGGFCQELFMDAKYGLFATIVYGILEQVYNKVVSVANDESPSVLFRRLEDLREFDALTSRLPFPFADYASHLLRLFEAFEAESDTERANIMMWLEDRVNGNIGDPAKLLFHPLYNTDKTLVDSIRQQSLKFNLVQLARAKEDGDLQVDIRARDSLFNYALGEGDIEQAILIHETMVEVGSRLPYREDSSVQAGLRCTQIIKTLWRLYATAQENRDTDGHHILASERLQQEKLFRINAYANQCLQQLLSGREWCAAARVLDCLAMSTFILGGRIQAISYLAYSTRVELRSGHSHALQRFHHGELLMAILARFWCAYPAGCRNPHTSRNLLQTELCEMLQWDRGELENFLALVLKLLPDSIPTYWTNGTFSVICEAQAILLTHKDGFRTYNHWCTNDQGIWKLKIQPLACQFEERALDYTSFIMSYDIAADRVIATFAKRAAERRPVESQF